LILNNHFERLKIVASGLQKWIQVNREVLSKGSSEASQLLKKVKSQQKKTNRVRTLVKSTLEGALQQMKRELRTDVDHFFDNRSGEIIPNLIQFVKNYNISPEQYRTQLAENGFSDTLYIVFQEFKHSIDTYMAENINPQIFNHVKIEEEKIKDFFESVLGPYEIMVNDALLDYNSAMEKLGLGVASEIQKPESKIDIVTIKNFISLELPPAAATMNYSTAIKTEAIVRLGVYNFFKGLKKVFRRPIHNETENAVSALKDSIKRMKKETDASLVFHFKNYKENLKFQYFFKLLEAVSGHIYDVMMDRFYDYTSDLSQLTNATAKKQINKEQLSKNLAELEVKTEKVFVLINQFRIKLEEHPQCGIGKV